MPVIIFVLKLLLICAKYFENSAQKLFSNSGMNMFKPIKKYFRFQKWNSYIRTILSAAYIANEFDNVVYVYDGKLAAIKMISTMRHTSDFLNAIGKLSKAFSVHENHAQCSIKSLTEAVAPTRECITVLEPYVDCIKEKNENLPEVLNGPECGISSKTSDSIKLLEWGLMQLQSNLEDYEKCDVNFLSSMTIDIEHLHSTVNYKQGLQTMLQYLRSFASCYTSKDSWYTLQENPIHFKDIKMPVPLPPTKMIEENKETLQEWASANGRAVRQRLVHQETTMAKAGALPESFYHQKLKPTDANENVECYSDDPENNEIENLEYDSDDSLDNDCLKNYDKEFEFQKRRLSWWAEL